MRIRDAVSPHHPLRSWPRRLIYSTRTRPDIQIAKLERRRKILESTIDFDALASEGVLEYVELLRPSQIEGLTLCRIGSSNDGGYVVPLDLLVASGGVVSIGIGDNNDADITLARRGIPVQSWDHTVDALPVSHPLISFHKHGLGNSPPVSWSLDDITRSSFPREVRPLVLLLDVEGAEWTALDRASSETLDRFSVIVVEFHEMGSLLIQPEPFLRVLRRLRRTFIPVAIHANNYMPTWDISSVCLPDALEVTLIHRESVDTTALRAGNCDVSMFSPCCPDLPDVESPWAYQDVNSS